MNAVVENIDELTELKPEKKKKENRVSEHSIEKFKYKFADICSQRGTDTIEITIEELAENCGLAVATVHRVIEKLDEQGWLKKIKTKSRRFMNKYKWMGLAEDPMPTHTPISGENVFVTFADMQHEIYMLKTRLYEQEELTTKFMRENKMLREKLALTEQGVN